MHQLHHHSQPLRPSRALRLAALRLRSRLAAAAFLAALDRYRALRTKEFDQNQPRVPAGSPEGGQWTTGEAGGGGGEFFELPTIEVTPVDLVPLAAVAGIGHNRGPSLDEPPQIPKQDPGGPKSKLQTAKDAAKWLAIFGVRRIPVVAGVLLAVEGAQWLRSEWPSIRSYRDPPKTMDELMAGARETRPGYQKHHMREQGPARTDGFPTSMIDAPDNIVSVPTYKHREISAWYQTKNKRFGNLSPRDYLRGKRWDERRRVGEFALRKYKVLK